MLDYLGQPKVTLETLPGSTPQRLTLMSWGAFEEMTEGSIKAVSQVRTHAGIAHVLQYIPC